MKKLTKLKTSIITLCTVVCAAILGLSVSLSGGTAADAFVNSANFSTTSTYTLVPELTNATGSADVFNQTNLTRLYSVLLGNSSNNTTFEQVENYVKGTSTYKGFTIPKYYSNANLRTNNGNKEIIVTFGGQQWIPVMLTRSGATNATESDVILTLMLAKLASNTSKWAAYAGDNTTANSAKMYPTPMYTTSYIRTATLNNGGYYATQASYTNNSATNLTFVAQSATNQWAKFTMTQADLNAAGQSSVTSLYPYIAAPNELQYQKHVSWNENTGQPKVSFPNDNLGTQATTQGTMTPNFTGKTGSSYLRTNNGKTYDTGYYGWGNDKLWLPATCETGRNAYSTTYQFTGLWNLSSNALKNASGSTTITIAGSAWHRDGHSTIYNCVYSSYDNGGAGAAAAITDARSYRPALHLNLTKAADLGVTLEDPTNVPTTYNGDAQTLKSVYTANNSSASWYNTKWYDHTGNYVKVTHYAEDGTEVANVKNAGEYWVKVEITSAWVNAVNTQTDTDGASWGLSAAQIASAKVRRKPKFRGTPDTSDPNHLESDSVRWFKLVVNPKEVTVNKPTYNALTGVFSPPTFANPTELYADKPELATVFTGTAADGTVVNQLNTVPEKRGPYTAQAILVDSDGVTPYSGGNYVIKNASAINCEVKIGYKQLTIPSASEGTKTYTGSDIKFILSGYNEEWRELATLIVPDNLKLEGNDTDGWYLVAKDAGTYSVTAVIKAEYKADWCWNSSAGDGIVEDQVVSVTITRKTLFIDFTSSNGAFIMQQGMDVKFSAEPSNAVDGDEVKISLQYCNVLDDSNKIPVPGGVLDASTIEEAGTYRIYASLDDSAAEVNKNYVLDASGSYQDFSISAQNINIESLSWEYRENGGAATPISEGSGASEGSPFALEYTGGTFTFALGLNAAGLASRGVKVDTTYGVNGYTNATQTNFTENAVAVTVRVIPVNEGYAFNGANGKPRDEQYEDFTIYVKIDKANIDFSKVKWSADSLEYNPLGNKVEVASGIPSFLNITYNEGASGIAVGDYKAEVRSLVVKNNAADIATSLNYNIPTLTEVRANENLKHDWKITKKKINVTWIPKEESGEYGIVWIPYIIDNSFDVIEYTYYLDSDEAMANPMSLDDIMEAYDATNVVDYVVCARVNNANFVLVENSNEVEYSLSAFQAGDTKIPVKVNLRTDKVVYNGTKQEAFVEVDSGGVKINVTVTYYVKGESGQFDEPLTDPDQPMDAGEYEVRVALSPDVSAQMAISGQRKFLYTIEKADVDLSAMKWVDTENDNEEYTGPYTYVYGVSHTLAYSGDSLDLIDGLKMEYTSASGTDAGKYTVKVTFSVDDADLFDESNYNVPEDIEFEWEILPYTPDLSGVKWNYNAEPFVFKIIGGIPVKHSARLIGFPEEYAEELAGMITYSDEDPGAFSDVGIHTTGFTVNETHEKRGNYGAFVFPAGLESTITWEIHPLKVEKAEQRQTKPFCAEGYGLDEVTNLPEDFYEYFDVQVLDDNSQEVPQVDGTWNFRNIGRYRIKITFKNGMNKNSGGQFDNVKWADNSRSAYQIILTVEKLVLTANGWTNGTELEKPVLNTEKLEDIEKYFDYVLKKQGSDEVIAMDATLEYDTAYQIYLKLKEEYSGNVTIDYNGEEGEETKPHTFVTGPDPLADLPVNFYEIPEKLTIEYPYTGSEITFGFGDWYDSDVMQVIGAMKGTEVGEYPVMVGFVSGSLAAWGTEDEYVSVITVTFVIFEDEAYGKFVLKDTAKKNAFKFQYEDFSELEGDIKDYVYGADNVVYMTKLTCEDTLADLLAQFKNEDIKVYDEAGTPITDMTSTLATGMILRLEDGGTVLNQLTISVLGDVDGDGDITTVDKAQLNAYSLGTLDLAGAKLLAGDIDDDGDITTVDKAQLNAYTLGSFDIYENLILKTATAQVLSVEAEEGEADDVVVTLALSEEVIVKSEEVRKDISEEEPAERTPADKAEAVTDTRRLRLYF